jgi:hypothetical protein
MENRIWRCAVSFVVLGGDEQQKYFVFQGKIDKRECLVKIVQ